MALCQRQWPAANQPSLSWSYVLFGPQNGGFFLIWNNFRHLKTGNFHMKTQMSIVFLRNWQLEEQWIHFLQGPWDRACALQAPQSPWFTSSIYLLGFYRNLSHDTWSHPSCHFEAPCLTVQTTSYLGYTYQICLALVSEQLKIMSQIFEIGELLPGINSGHLKERFLCRSLVSYPVGCSAFT